MRRPPNHRSPHVLPLHKFSFPLQLLNVLYYIITLLSLSFLSSSHNLSLILTAARPLSLSEQVVVVLVAYITTAIAIAHMLLPLLLLEKLEEERRIGNIVVVKQHHHQPISVLFFIHISAHSTYSSHLSPPHLSSSSHIILSSLFTCLS